MSDKEKLKSIIKYLKDYLKEVERCSSNDREFNANGCGVNACEVKPAIKEIIKDVNKILKGEKPYIFHYEDFEEE